MIEKIALGEAIKDANIIETIRSNMPLSSEGRDGLASSFLSVISYTSADTVDCNEMPWGSYVICYRTINGPRPTGYCIFRTSGYSNDWKIQTAMYTGVGNADIYIRVFYSGSTWSNWVKLH